MHVWNLVRRNTETSQDEAHHCNQSYTKTSSLFVFCIFYRLRKKDKVLPGLFLRRIKVSISVFWQNSAEKWALCDVFTRSSSLSLLSHPALPSQPFQPECQTRWDYALEMWRTLHQPVHGQPVCPGGDLSGWGRLHHHHSVLSEQHCPSICLVDVTSISDLIS